MGIKGTQIHPCKPDRVRPSDRGVDPHPLATPLRSDG